MIPAAHRTLPLLCLSLCALAGAAHAQPHTLADCAGIVDNGLRLSCYDSLAVATGAPPASTVPPPAAQPVPAPSTTAQPAPAQAAAAVPHRENVPSSDRLSAYWELSPQDKRGTFQFRPHNPNYLIATYTDAPNNGPYRPFEQDEPDYGGLSHAELQFQLGFKMKLVEDAFNTPVDLWFGYTQQSFWQATNHRDSSPFRETNYQPELMAVVPIDFRLLGWRARFINLGLVHQSNGQASTLSRSWNRYYAQIGLERGDMTVLARVWKRISESPADDDNPDIVDYMGHGDLQATYYWHGQEFSALLRRNFSTGKGAAQLGWSFPVAGNLNGYVQLFSGYGQSLIDYNYWQRSIGVGILMKF